MNTNWLDYTLLTLVIIGAINWGLIGFSVLTSLPLFLAICHGSPGSSMRLSDSAVSI